MLARRTQRAPGASLVAVAILALGCLAQEGAPEASPAPAPAPVEQTPVEQAPAPAAVAEIPPPPAPIVRPASPLASWNVLPGGDFEQPPWEGAQRYGTDLPWWRVAEGRPRGHRVTDGVLELAPGSGVQRPCWFWPASRELGGAGFVLRGRAGGDARLELEDEDGRVELPLDGGPGLTAFELPLADLEQRLGRPLHARWHLRLVAGDAPARFDDLQLLVDLPDPGPEDLAAELAAEVDRVLDLLTAHATDRVGPRHTGYVVQTHDVLTGAPLGLQMASVGVLHETMLVLAGSETVATLAPDLHGRATALLEAHVPEFLELSLHPDTHLPRLYDPSADQPLERPIEASRYLAFLLDLATEGPASVRADCLAAATRMGEAVLAGGVVPTGEVASRFHPALGKGDTSVPSLRKLDMPAELVRLGVLLDDERYLAAARAALSEFEYLHMWGGSWDSIDPGLDDFYGHFGNRSVTMARALPEEALMLRLGLSGLDKYGPMWRRTLAHGAFVAADQVRGWKGFIGVAELVPERRAGVAEMISMAVAAHLVGELDDAGRWVDVSHNLWEPRFGLEVGDRPGVPGNLLEGLALAHELAGLEGTGAGGPDAPYLDRRFLRGAFLAVLRTTEETYGRPYGLLPMRAEARGANPSGADLRLLGPLAHMLDQL